MFFHSLSLHHSRLQPFLDQAENGVVGLFDPLPENAAVRPRDGGRTLGANRATDYTKSPECHSPKSSSPSFASSRRTTHPALGADCALPEAVRETPKILLIDLIEDGDHSLLENLVLERRAAVVDHPVSECTLFSMAALDRRRAVDRLSPVRA